MRKTTEWERLEISSRKLEIPREQSRKDEHNKGQKLYDLTEAEDIKKRWQEYTEELYKKKFHDQDNHDSPRARYPGMRSQEGLRKHH